MPPRRGRERGTLRDQLDAIPFEPIPAGRGRISGHVRTAAGQPLEGVLVVATPSSIASPHLERPGAAGEPTDEDVVEQVRAYTRYLQTRLHGRRRTRSGPDGRFALSGLGARRYTLEAFKEGYEIGIGGFPFPREIRPDAGVAFEAKRVVRVPVEVRLPGGTRPARAYLVWSRVIRSGARTGRTDAWRSEAPWIELTPGTYHLYATPWGDLETRSAPVAFVVSETEAPAPLALAVGAKPGLVVRVERPEGFSAGAVRPWAVRVTGSELPTDAELVASALSRQVWPGNQEQQRWPNLEAGDYLVGAGLAGSQRVLVRRVVALVDRGVDCTLELPVPDPTAHYLVRPISPEGLPLGEVTWSVETDRRGRRSRRRSPALRRDDGIFFVMVPPDLLGAQTVIASHHGFGDVREKVAADWTDPVTFAFQRPAWADVTIEGQIGRRTRRAAAGLAYGLGNQHHDPRAAGRKKAGRPRPAAPRPRPAGRVLLEPRPERVGRQRRPAGLPARRPPPRSAARLDSPSAGLRPQGDLDRGRRARDPPRKEGRRLDSRPGRRRRIATASS